MIKKPTDEKIKLELSVHKDALLSDPDQVLVLLKAERAKVLPDIHGIMRNLESYPPLHAQSL